MISTLDANKAVGQDIISNKMLIAVKVQISKPLCMLFNIMVFSSRDTKLYFNFDFEGASLRDVELHKHLGVIFSNNCKWTKHIDKLIEKSSKQINVLRKLKFKLK
jgi:hypothetical protein